jgi:hypothetical protein
MKYNLQIHIFQQLWMEVSYEIVASSPSQAWWKLA